MIILQEFGVATLVFILFCITHSLFALKSLKQKIFRVLPGLKSFYRMLYNLLSGLLLLLWLITLPEDRIYYQTHGVWMYLLIGIQVLAAWAAIKSLKGHGAVFLGITQLRRFFQKGELPNYLDEPKKGSLIRSGFYAYIRHPLYSFSMIILLASPLMTQNLVYIIICVGLYFYVGSFFEERGLIKRFGDQYRTYQKEVPRFIPNLFHILDR
jgi:protein-S-isoprenylcysteine O-methyltransferase Ste14